MLEPNNVPVDCIRVILTSDTGVFKVPRYDISKHGQALPCLSPEAVVATHTILSPTM
jgi:hypothetical protein